MRNVLLNDGILLVHCIGGLSKSPAICVAYLMQTNSINLLQSYLFVQQCRPKVLIDSNYLQQLRHFETEQNLVPN